MFALTPPIRYKLGAVCRGSLNTSSVWTIDRRRPSSRRYPTWIRTSGQRFVPLPRTNSLMVGLADCRRLSGLPGWGLERIDTRVTPARTSMASNPAPSSLRCLPNQQHHRAESRLTPLTGQILEHPPYTTWRYLTWYS